MNCKSLVELVTEYLEGALPSPSRRQFEEHLAACPGCRTYLEQTQQAVGALRRLRDDSVPEDARERVLQAFRGYMQTKKKRTERNIQLGVRSQYVAPGDHIAYFWETEQDFEEAVGFLEVGLRADDHCFVFGHEQANEKVLGVLRKRGLQVDGLFVKGQLCIVGGNASADTLLANIGGLFQAALAGGAPLIRLLGNLGWGRENWPGEDEILQFEAKVTEAVRQFPCVVVCMYDVRSLSGRILLKGGFETHPSTMCRGALRENPYHVPTETFLAHLRAAFERPTLQ